MLVAFSSFSANSDNHCRKGFMVGQLQGPTLQKKTTGRSKSLRFYPNRTVSHMFRFEDVYGRLAEFFKKHLA